MIAPVREELQDKTTPRTEAAWVAGAAFCRSDAAPCRIGAETWEIWFWNVFGRFPKESCESVESAPTSTGVGVPGAGPILSAAVAECPNRWSQAAVYKSVTHYTQVGYGPCTGCGVGGRGWVERPAANDQRSPAPHRTEQTDFPYSALRTHSSGSFPGRRARQRIESIVRVQALVGVGGPQPARAGVFAPNPPT